MEIQQKLTLHLAFVSIGLLSLFPFANTTTAQTIKQRIGFSSVYEIGLLTGDKGEAAMLQTVNGIRKGKSFAGIGAGFDFYGIRSIPLFVNYRRDVLAGKNVPFLYASGGLNFAWISSAEKVQWDVHTSSPGHFYDVGAGWKLSGKNGRGFVLTAGYAVKQVQYKTPFYTIISAPEPQIDSYTRYNFIYRRVVIKAGFQF